MRSSWEINTADFAAGAEQRDNIKVVRAALADVLQSKDASFFLCGADKALSRITLHTTHRNAIAPARNAARAALEHAGFLRQVEVVAHDASEMNRPHSLEQLLAAFPHEILIHDPTAVFGRAKALVMAAKAVRQLHGNAIGGIYLNPGARLVFVVSADEGLSSKIVRSLEDAIEASAAALGSVQINRPPIRVRVVDQLPELDLVAIDALSIRTNPNPPKSKRLILALTASIGLAAVPAAAMASQGNITFQTASAALPGLSVFSDGGGVSAFTTQGIDYYFGMAVKTSGFRQLAQVQMPELRVFGLTIRPRTGVPGQDQDQGGVGS